MRKCIKDRISVKGFNDPRFFLKISSGKKYKEVLLKR